MKILLVLLACWFAAKSDPTGPIYAFCSDPPVPRTVALLQILSAVSAVHFSVQRLGHFSVQFNNMYNSAWKRAHIAADKTHAQAHGEAISRGFSNLRVHDLKHTFGRRLRATGVSLETRKVLLGHRNGDITSNYSAPEIEELLAAANRICEVNPRKSPALTFLKRKTG
jgi:integrase